MHRVNRHAAMGAALLAGTLLLETACRPEEADEVVRTPAVEVAPAVEPPLPAPGTAWVALDNGLVSVRSNGAQRWAILEQLAQKARFKLLRGDLKRRAMTLRIEDAPLGEALASLLVGVHYSLEFDFVAEKGSHVVRELTVGPPVIVVATAAVAAAPPPETDREGRELLEKVRARLAAMSPEEKQRMREQDVARAEAAEPQLLVQLDEPDPLVRADAVSLLPIFGEGAEGEERFQRLVTLLAEDPDRNVRIAATERLGEFDSPEAVEPLVLALSDADRDVVLAAIEALTDVDDVSAIPDLELLVEDYDEEIRDAAILAIQSIE
jgi:hypothetical protein